MFVAFLLKNRADARAFFYIFLGLFNLSTSGKSSSQERKVLMVGKFRFSLLLVEINTMKRVRKRER